MSGKEASNGGCQSWSSSGSDPINAKRQRFAELKNIDWVVAPNSVILPLVDRANTLAAVTPASSLSSIQMHTRPQQQISPTQPDNQERTKSNPNDSDVEVFGDPSSCSIHSSSKSIFGSSQESVSNRADLSSQQKSLSRSNSNRTTSEFDEAERTQALDDEDSMNRMSATTAQPMDVGFLVDLDDETQEPWAFQAAPTLPAAAAANREADHSKVTSFSGMNFGADASASKQSDESNDIEDVSEPSNASQYSLASNLTIRDTREAFDSKFNVGQASLADASDSSDSASILVDDESVDSNDGDNHDDDDDNDDDSNDNFGNIGIGDNDDHIGDAYSDDFSHDQQHSNAALSIHETESNEQNQSAINDAEAAAPVILTDVCDDSDESTDDATTQAKSRRRSRNINKSKLATALACQMRLADADRAMWSYEHDDNTPPSRLIQVGHGTSQWGLCWTHVIKSITDGNSENVDDQNQVKVAVLDSKPFNCNPSEQIALYEPIARVHCAHTDVLLGPRYHRTVNVRNGGSGN